GDPPAHARFEGVDQDLDPEDQRSDAAHERENRPQSSHDVLDLLRSRAATPSLGTPDTRPVRSGNSSVQQSASLSTLTIREIRTGSDTAGSRPGRNWLAMAQWAANRPEVPMTGPYSSGPAPRIAPLGQRTLVLAVLMVAASVPQLSAQALIGFTGGTAANSVENDGDTIGWSFTTSQRFVLTHLGYWDGDFATLP